MADNARTTRALVGRDNELQLLRSHLITVSRGKPRIVFVTGEAGIGKSRLVREVLPLAVQRGFLTASSRAVQSITIPYFGCVRLLERGQMIRKLLQYGLATLLAGGVMFSGAHASAASNVLKDIPVTGTVADGREFTGKLRVTRLTLGEGGQLLASGTLRGSIDGVRKSVRQTFENVPATLTGNSGTSALVAGPADPLVCDILFLDINPISLDLLGLAVDLSQVTLDIDAVPRRGKSGRQPSMRCNRSTRRV